ncbi:MAG: ATP phosphoribosyltransferase regulatory subunit [Rhodospirillaceae bacterium]|nr:ATP phosphoribosyltransferase regulatory subunit [Rhodospirillaceae bacterium]|tara:strand:- start:4671 stop:5837 length:1167 start_codon:yes stop_codon:yes gene_type:complete
MIDNLEDAVLPSGLADLLPPFAAHEEVLATRLRDCFGSAGYELVKPPLLEFEAALLKGIGADVAKEAFRLMDPVSHNMMAVRADITPQVARLAWTQLRRAPRPLRVMYDGEVLRTPLGGSRQKRGFRTVGAELIGSADAAMADVEVILLAADSLLDVGIKDLTVDINVPSMAQFICSDIKLSLAETQHVVQALSRKDRSAIEKVGGDNEGQLLGLLSAGGDAEECLKKLKRLNLPDEAAVLNARLGEVVSLIKKRRPNLRLTIDPAETRGFEYHLGVSFAVFARGAPSELGMGGRYQSNEDEMATGFSLFMDVLTDLVPMQVSAQRLYLPFGASSGISDELRKAGWVVVHGLVPEADIESEGRRLLCSHLWMEDEVCPLPDLQEPGAR